MAKPDFLLKLTSFVDAAWPNVRDGHALGAVDDRYPCANPEGPVDNSDCPEDEPLCNCPCQELIPTKEASSAWWPWIFAGYGGGWLWGGGDEGGPAEEPTNEQIQEASEKIKECDYIESELGSSYLGCLWNDQSHPSSCDCPCRGENFGKYIEYTRTYATYWDTPKETPLWRNAQMFLINSQKAAIVLNGDLTLRPGQLINIQSEMPGSESEETQNRRFGGRWLVTDINHVITGMNHKMLIGLSRDSSPIAPDESSTMSWF